MADKTNLISSDLKEKITNEKRRRYQIYTALDYLRSHKNKFDFFSYDSIKLLQTSKDLAKSFNQKKVTTELLLLSFLSSNSELLKICEKFNISFTSVQELILYGYDLKSVPLQNKNYFSSFLKIVTNSSKNVSENNDNTNYNYEVKIILEKAIENAFRFKTPVITSEILFLTLLEEKNCTGGALLKIFLKTDLEWNLVRYEILKKLHNQETTIQGQLEKSLRYFAYLLKTELDDSQFEKLVQKKNFSDIILNYRDVVISKVLEFDIFNEIENDLKFSIKTNTKRNYSI